MKNKKIIIGVSLIVLIISIIIVTCFVMNTNAETVAEETTKDVIEDEKTFVRMAAALSRGTDSNSQVKVSTLQDSLDMYTGHKYRATVTEKSSTTLLATFGGTGNQYEITIDTGDVWELSSVTYNVDSGSVYTEKFVEGDNVLQPTTFTPTKSGWTFVGWREDTTASSEVLTSKVMGTNAITLYAVYEQSVTLSYNGNGATSGSVASQSKTRYYNAAGNYYNPKVVLSSNGFTRTGYTFNGWDLGAVGTEIELNEDKTAKVKWKLNTLTVMTGGTLQGDYAAASVNLRTVNIDTESQVTPYARITSGTGWEIFLHPINGARGLYSTLSKTVNLTDFNTLTVNVSRNQQDGGGTSGNVTRFGITTSETTNSYTKYVNIGTSTGKFTLDVSNYSGNYYLMLYHEHEDWRRYVTINNITLSQ